MSLTFPYSLPHLSDMMKQVKVTFDLQRNDELSGSGDGRYWTSELSTPLWMVKVDLSPRSLAEARSIDAKIRALSGAKNAFLFSEIGYRPAAGGTAGSGVTVAAISDDRTALALSGLPAGYAISIGDRFSITSASGAVYFGEFSEAEIATGSGATEAISVMPYAPLWLATGDSVELSSPCLKVFVKPGGHTPFAMGSSWSESGAVTLLQQKS